MSKNRIIPHFPFADHKRNVKDSFTRDEMERMYEHLVRYIEELRIEMNEKVSDLQNQINNLP